MLKWSCSLVRRSSRARLRFARSGRVTLGPSLARAATLSGLSFCLRHSGQSRAVTNPVTATGHRCAGTCAGRLRLLNLRETLSDGSSLPGAALDGFPLRSFHLSSRGKEKGEARGIRKGDKTTPTPRSGRACEHHGTEHMKKKPYSEQLRDPRWQRKRLELMQAADFTCLECGNKTETLNVHHGFYCRGTSVWEYPNDTYSVLCETCHSKAQDLMESVHSKIATLCYDQLSALNGMLNEACDPESSHEDLSPAFLILRDLIYCGRVTANLPEGLDDYQWAASISVTAASMRTRAQTRKELNQPQEAAA